MKIEEKEKDDKNDNKDKNILKKWDRLDEMGLPIIDKIYDPVTAKEVEIVRTLIN